PGGGTPWYFLFGHLPAPARPRPRRKNTARGRAPAGRRGGDSGKGRASEWAAGAAGPAAPARAPPAPAAPAARGAGAGVGGLLELGDAVAVLLEPLLPLRALGVGGGVVGLHPAVLADDQHLGRRLVLDPLRLGAAARAGGPVVALRAALEVDQDRV